MSLTLTEKTHTPKWIAKMVLLPPVLIFKNAQYNIHVYMYMVVTFMSIMLYEGCSVVISLVTSFNLFEIRYVSTLPCA